MVILTRKHGADYTGATVRVMVAGTAAPSLFGLAIAYAYPGFGILWGTLASVAFAIVISLGVSGLLWAADREREEEPTPA